MGLETREGGNFITILGGKFCQRVQEGTEGSFERVNKIGKTVHEKFYDNFTGHLMDIKIKDSDYGKTWNFSFQDTAEIYTLQLSYSNSFSTALLKMLPNIDLAQEMKLSPSVKEVDGKNKSSLFINQGGVALKHAYTRENPNGMPDMEQVTIKGVLQWDDTKRLAFLENMVTTTILPKLAEIKAAQTTAPVKVTPAGTPAVAIATPAVTPVPAVPVTPAPVAPTPAPVAPVSPVAPATAQVPAQVPQQAPVPDLPF